MLSGKIDFLDFSSPAALTKMLSAKLRKKRLGNNLSQEALASRSGVSLGSLKRFESKGEIFLKHLMMLAVALGAGEEFTVLFPEEPYHSIEDVLRKQQETPRKRGRKKF